MEQQNNPEPGLQRRRVHTVAAAQLINGEPLFPDESALLLTPAVSDLASMQWLNNHRQQLLTTLQQHGALLLRGFGLNSIEHFQAATASLAADKLLEYQNRSTPRTRLKGNIYTSTEYPAEYEIPLHNENAYTNSWPEIVYFYSAIVAESGGETPICDSRKIYQSLSSGIVQAFERHGVQYVRNYGGLDLPWQEVFQTSDKAMVEQFCQQQGIQFVWQSGHQLKTWQTCQASLQHPQSGELVWFNQAHLFHISSLPSSTQAALLASHGEDALPRNAYFGDGSPIPLHMLDEIRHCYQQHKLKFAWQSGDLLILDNILYAHGREPFSGSRQVVVAMSAYDR